MVDEKKPALVETINPSPSGSAAAATVSTSINEGTVPATTTRDPWLESIFGPTSTSSVSPTSSSRKLHFTRPMSEIHYGTNSHPHFATLAQPTTQRDNPLSRQTLTRIYEGTGALSSSPPPEPAPSLPRSNPSPLHFRAISMAANLIGTGAITPAKLYAKRTHTLIAKWTLGLLMNSRDRNGHGNGFPIIREAACPEQEVKMRPSNSSSGSNGACVEDKDRWAQDQDEDEDIIHPLLSPRTLSPRLLSPRLYGSSGGSGSGNSSSLANFGGSTSNSSGGGGCGGGGSGPVSHMSMGSSMYSSYHSNSMAPPISDRSVVEMSDISSPTRSLSPSSSFSGFSGGFGGGESKPTTDRYGFYTNARPVAVQQGLLKLTEAYTIEELDTPKSQADGSERDTFDFAKPCESPKSGHSHPPSIHAGLEGYQTSVITVATTVTTTATVTATATTKSSFSGDGIAAATASLTSSISAGGAGPSLSTYSITSSVLSTTAPRPTSTLSTPVAPTTTVTAILSQLKDLHDSVQMSQKEKWDAFLRKRRRKLHQGELHGNMSSSNLGSPLFSSLSLTLEEDQPEDDDWLYWSSQQLIGLATMGKGADWEEFRDLVRGGIPVVYRNKIWMEASGAWDMRQPGYYQELLSAIRPEQSPCWSDIEMDLHRTFPTNILFGYGGQGIDKLRNLLTAYAIYNPTVGYCQGMNLLAGTLLLTNHSEEDAFWVLTCILGRLLPADYFTKQLLAPQADQRVLRELVQEIMPRLSSHLDEMHVDLTAITFSWFLTLFTDCLPVETLVRVWDVLFVEGMLAVFRIAVALLWLNEKEIIKCRNGATIYCYMKQMTQGMHQADKLLKTAMVTLKSAIHPDKVEAKRIRYNKQIREEHIREEQLLQESAARRRRSKSPPPQQPPPLSSALLPSTAKELSLTPSNTTTTSTDAADVSATTLSPTSPSPQVATTTSMDNEPVGSPRATSPPRYIPRSPGSAQSTRPLRAV
ncbi:hypothetical protein BGZ73_008361 [Actinomortierella ambigua]|nr:hypothetical protein BGZ73_008361 [Actinomortierella ambigua]